MKKLSSVIGLAGVLFAFAGISFAQGAGAVAPAAGGTTSTPITLNDATIYQASFAALTMLFVVAVLLENAFATIFSWRVFLAYFSSRGVKTLIMIVASLIVVNAFDLDTVASLIAAYKSHGKPAPLPPESDAFSKFITALILAGGSAGVNNLMVALGFRQKTTPEAVAPQVAENKAWFAVTVTRKAAVGNIEVKIRDLGPAAGLPGAPAPIAGTVGGPRPSLRDILLRNPNRFPQNGGYTLIADHVYQITVEGQDATGAPLVALGGQTFVFASRAIVDLRVTL